MQKLSPLTIAAFAVLGFSVAAGPLTAADPLPATGFAALELGPETTRITSPLNRLGYPDYTAAMNTRLSQGVSRDENFWVLMWPALGNAETSSDVYISQVEAALDIQIARTRRLGMASDVVNKAMLAVDEHDRMIVNSRPWSREEFPEFAAWLDANAANIEEVHQAALRPKAYAPLVAGDGPYPMVSILLPHVQALRHAGRLLVARALLRLHEGDNEGAWQDLLDTYRIAKHCGQGFTLIEQLVGVALRQAAHQTTALWLAQSQLSADEIETRLAELRPYLQQRSLAESIDCERYMYLDIVCAMSSGASSSGELLGLLEPNSALVEGSGAPPDNMRAVREAMFQMLMSGVDVNETLRYGNGMYDQFMEAVEPASHLERAERLAVLDDRVKEQVAATRDTGELLKTYFFSSRKDFQRIPAKVLTGLLLPAIESCETAFTRSDASSAALVAAFQVQAYIAETGEMPLTLEEVAAAGRTIPLDPFTETSLRFVADDRGLVIYSIGANGIDDGGRQWGDGGEPMGDDQRVILPAPL
jgi:hypothetical protein